MSKILLIHNSDQLFESLKPSKSSERPLFYWYSDRFVSFQGTQKYIYLFLVDPSKANVELNVRRSAKKDFDGLHKDFLHYKYWVEGDHDDKCWCISKGLNYAESGIAMSFSELKPDLVLMNRYYGSSREEWMATDFEIIRPVKPFSKRVIKLFNKPYDELYKWEPTPFINIPEIVDLLPELKEAYPIEDPERGENGKYLFDDWRYMSNVPKDTMWL